MNDTTDPCDEYKEFTEASLKKIRRLRLEQKKNTEFEKECLAKTSILKGTDISQKSFSNHY